MVFIGKVEQTSTVAAASEVGTGSQQIVSVRVDEAFKGVKTGEHVTLHQPVNSCSPDYSVGQDVLFYLHPAAKKGAWLASACHRSRPLAESADDLLFLRALPGSLKRTRLSGEVELFEDSTEEGFRKQRSLGGVHVTIAGERALTEAFTNADGVYEVYDLPAGVYRVSIDIPQRMRLRFPMPFGRQILSRLRQEEINLPAGGSAGMSFVLMVDNQMSGRILDPEGNPMKDVCVELEPAWATGGRGFYVTDCSNKEGRFILTDMPAGQYRIGINRSGHPTASEPFSTLYYPGTADKQRATVLTIGEGEHLDMLDIRIPELARRIRLSGRMQFSDGVPIARGFVMFVGSDGKYKEQGATEDDGSFQLTVVAGAPGDVEGQIWVDQDSVAKCPEFQAKIKPGGIVAILAPQPIFVGGQSDQSGVLLVYPFPSCREWRNYALHSPDGR